MHLREFFSADAISLDLQAAEKDDILKELISLLKLDEKSEAMLYKMLKRRENLGSKVWSSWKPLQIFTGG